MLLRTVWIKREMGMRIVVEKGVNNAWNVGEESAQNVVENSVDKA